MSGTQFCGRGRPPPAASGRRTLSTVHSSPEPLTLKEHRLLVEIVGREAPDLLPSARKTARPTWLTDEECDALSTPIEAVLFDQLDRDGEAARRAADEADDLLGRLQMQREGYWR